VAGIVGQDGIDANLVQICQPLAKKLHKAGALGDG